MCRASRVRSQRWEGLGPGGHAVTEGESGPKLGWEVSQGPGLPGACLGILPLWGLSPAENC